MVLDYSRPCLFVDIIKLFYKCGCRQAMMVGHSSRSLPAPFTLLNLICDSLQACGTWLPNSRPLRESFPVFKATIVKSKRFRLERFGVLSLPCPQIQQQTNNIIISAFLRARWTILQPYLLAAQQDIVQSTVKSQNCHARSSGITSIMETAARLS